MKKIGIYGGTFNPPHRGHILAAKEAVERLDLDRLILIPAAAPPHKGGEEILDGNTRMELLRLSCGEIPQWEISDLELRRGGVSYTVRTLEALQRQYPGDRLVFLMGTDMFLSFPTWFQPERICAMAALGVMCRGQGGVRREELCRIAEEYGEKYGAEVLFVENSFVPVSSTELRRMIAFDCAGPLLMPEALNYIQEKGLYGAGENYKNLPIPKLEETVCGLLAPKRVAHVLGCRETAVKLARHHGADEADAERAGLLHDITKLLSASQQLILCREYGIILDDFSQKNPKILHARTGSAVAERIFGENERVCRAILWHTTGRADMTLLEKIIYIADYMEPNRDFDGVDRLRDLAYSDLDQAVCLGIQMSADVLMRTGRDVSPDSLAAIRQLSKKNHA